MVTATRMVIDLNIDLSDKLRMFRGKNSLDGTTLVTENFVGFRMPDPPEKE